MRNRVAIDGAPAPGPARHDRLWVRKYGPADAGTVLVLVPGSPSGQGTSASLGPDIVARVPDLAVWAIDRRGNAFEDVSAFEQPDPDTSAGYYFLGEELNGQLFDPVEANEAGFVHKWRLRVEMRDVHHVVMEARKGGRQVLLGGHSMGGVASMTYATWDFNGRPAYGDLDGLVQIDGAAMGAFNQAVEGALFANRFKGVAKARRALKRYGRHSPFGFAGGLNSLPLWPVGVLPEVGCQYALADPDGPSVLQGIAEQLAELVPGLLPPGLIPSFPVTNEAFVGYLMTNTGESGVALESFRAKVGRLADSGNPRQWLNGPVSSVPRACPAFIQEPGNSFEWYYPLRIDVDALRGDSYLRGGRVARFLGLRTFHLHEVDLPLYAFESGLSEGGVVRGSRRFAQRSRVPRHTFVSEPSLGHLDPLLETRTTTRS